MVDEDVRIHSGRQFYNTRLGAPNVLELHVPPEVVNRTTPILADLQDALRRYRTELPRYGSASSRVGGFFFSRPLWASDITWVSADDDRAHTFFQGIFDELNVSRRMAQYIEHDENITLYTAFIVYRTKCTAPNYHVDYEPGVGTNAFTMMIPLSDLALLQERDDFQLLYGTSGDDEEELLSLHEHGFAKTYGWRNRMPDAELHADPPPPTVNRHGRLLTRRYVYRHDKAIAFGASFLHSTEPGWRAAPVAFLCFTFGTNLPEHWENIRKTVGYQGRYIGGQGFVGAPGSQPVVAY